LTTTSPETAAPSHSFAAAVTATLSLQAFGVPLATPSLTTAACVAILVFGLPHGTLDLQLIARARGTLAMSPFQTLLIYLALAAMTLLLWRIDPVLALATFVAVAVTHFAEDWADGQPSFLAHATALAILAAPTLLWREEVAQLFVIVAGDPDAARLADLLLTLAPDSQMVAAVALSIAWSEGRRNLAASGAASLAAMTFLPPAIGFALFFCLFHSPRHLGDSLRTLSGARTHHWGRVVLPLSAVALLLAIGIAMALVRQDASSQVVAASFMTLAVLTIPHMLTPMIVAAWCGRSKLTPAAA
jgi:Brp/Blh family beta-carotene 15,15'-monooxygenase